MKKNKIIENWYLINYWNQGSDKVNLGDKKVIKGGNMLVSGSIFFDSNATAEHLTSVKIRHQVIIHTARELCLTIRYEWSSSFFYTT